MRYRKKPIEIEAIQWIGNNFKECENFINGDLVPLHRSEVLISTLEGDMVASKGDFIIRGINGEFYPCKPDIFKKTYEPVK